MRSVNVLDSSDNVRLALHDLGGQGPTLFMSHATGFHGRIWQPIADRLSDQYHSIAVDYRGHGESDSPESGDMRWEGFGEDASVVADHLGGRLFGLGHSKGAAALLMAEIRRPGTFAALVVYEPVIFPTNGPRPAADHALAQGARRRRSTFATFDQALENFSTKPPMKAFDPACRDAYVRHGFRTTTEGTIELKCAPEMEARVYEGGGLHKTWDSLGQVRCPVLVLHGRVGPFGAAVVADKLAPLMPNATSYGWDFLTHFGPQEAPGLIAEAARSYFDEAVRH